MAGGQGFSLPAVHATEVKVYPASAGPLIASIVYRLGFRVDCILGMVYILLKLQSVVIRFYGLLKNKIPATVKRNPPMKIPAMILIFIRMPSRTVPANISKVLMYSEYWHF